MTLPRLLLTINYHEAIVTLDGVEVARLANPYESAASFHPLAAQWGAVFQATLQGMLLAAYEEAP